MRGSDGSCKETFFSVRQASGEGKESTSKKEILDHGAREIVRIEGAQEYRKKILRSGEAQSCARTPESVDGKRRKAHGSTFENDGTENDSKASAGTQARGRTSCPTREATRAQAASRGKEYCRNDGHRYC